jgi:hypothetical protein
MGKHADLGNLNFLEYQYKQVVIARRLTKI